MAAKKKKKSPKVTVTASGDVVGRGQVTGKGTLTVSLADASKVKLTVDKKPGGTKVVLSNATDIRLWKSHTLEIAGSLEKDLKKRELGGNVKLSFTLPKEVNVSVEHEFKPEDDRTCLKISFSF